MENKSNVLMTAWVGKTGRGRIGGVGTAEMVEELVEFRDALGRGQSL